MLSTASDLIVTISQLLHKNCEIMVCFVVAFGAMVFCVSRFLTSVVVQSQRRSSNRRSSPRVVWNETGVPDGQWKDKAPQRTLTSFWPRDEKDEIASVLSSSDEDDDRTVELEMASESNDNALEVYMHPNGLLCQYEKSDVALARNIKQGLSGAHMQDIYQALSNKKPFNGMNFAASRMEDFMKLAASQCKYLHNVQVTRPERADFHCAFAAVGYQIMALGLFMALQGPYQTSQVLDVMTRCAEGACCTEYEDMPKWLWALSMGMECSDRNQHPGFGILNMDEAGPGSPDSKMSPDELRRYLNGEDDGSSKEDGNRKKRKSG